MDWLWGLAFIGCIIALPFITWYCMTDGGTYKFGWSRSESSHTVKQPAVAPARPPKKLVIDLAYAHNSDDLDLAVEAWRQFPRCGVPDLLEEMGIAQHAKKLWLGQEIDQSLWLSWKKFLDASYAESQETTPESHEDFILELERSSQ